MSATIDFGIDLGTTNSSIAHSREGVVHVVPNDERSLVTPSVVYIERTGRMLVGKRAYDTWAQDPQNVQAEFKRWMGYNDRMPFPASGRSMLAEELSAEVLKALLADVATETQDRVTSAVITVPAAFGSLQCDATGRAARLAGLQNTPLLQEPIAAAIAYGATPQSRDQRWMVFDLGGGTLDIAIVSTRNDCLTILEHQGDNRLGGKDVDRIIAEEMLYQPLSAAFPLPDRQQQPREHERLMRMLVRQAELAKVQLSDREQVTVELFGLGSTQDGKAIEMTLTIDRADVEAKVRLLLDRCMQLAQRALTGARMSGADLDRVLLVGGPTQMPVVRAALGATISPRLDFSLDPLTVVARGAAMYASTLERTVAPQPASEGAGGSEGAATSGVVPVQLAYERASGTAQSPVAGVLPADSGIHEVKIQSAGGFWNSGWVAVADGCFQLEVMLERQKPSTQFSVAARDAQGRAIAVHPDKFAIAYMLPMAAPPLPHTIAIELTTSHGVSTFDTVFRRHCPLPAETRRTYRADRTLRPSEVGATLPIKFWEIDVSEDHNEKWWAGCVHIRSEAIRRPLLEGTELEVTVRIDQSRKMTAEVFVPLLNQSFTDGVYIPDPPAAQSQLKEQLDLCFEQVDYIIREIYETDREDLRERAHQLRKHLETIYERMGTLEKQHANDPDAMLGPTEELRSVRLQLAHLEEQLESSEGRASLTRTVRAEARFTEQVVTHCGTDQDKSDAARLQAQMARYAEAEDARGLKWIREQMLEVRALILDQQPWFWENVLTFLKQPGRRFLNVERAQHWILRAEHAQQSRNLPQLRECVNRVWELQPPDQVQMAKQQAAQSGLRGV